MMRLSWFKGVVVALLFLVSMGGCLNAYAFFFGTNTAIIELNTDERVTLGATINTYGFVMEEKGSGSPSKYILTINPLSFSDIFQAAMLESSLKMKAAETNEVIGACTNYSFGGDHDPIDSPERCAGVATAFYNVLPELTAFATAVEEGTVTADLATAANDAMCKNMTPASGGAMASGYCTSFIAAGETFLLPAESQSEGERDSMSHISHFLADNFVFAVLLNAVNDLAQKIRDNPSLEPSEDQKTHARTLMLNLKMQQDEYGAPLEIMHP